jgi:hypothetical protein
MGRLNRQDAEVAESVVRRRGRSSMPRVGFLGLSLAREENQIRPKRVVPRESTQIYSRALWVYITRYAAVSVSVSWRFNLPFVTLPQRAVSSTRGVRAG